MTKVCNLRPVKVYAFHQNQEALWKGDWQGWSERLLKAPDNEFQGILIPASQESSTIFEVGCLKGKKTCTGY